jgi:RNA methyltransferase, TrmH family
MSDEQSVYGVKAALALVERRPDDVLRIHYRADRRAQLKGILTWAASKRLPYRELDEESLRKVADGTHHEGLVVVAKALRYAPFEPGGEAPFRNPFQTGKSAPAQPAKQRPTTMRAPLWLALDEVQNPHNLGAILRSAAFFAADGVLVGGAAPGDKVNQAAIRVSEGGAEYLKLAATPDLAAALTAQAALGWMAIGLEPDGSPLPRQRPSRPTILVLGHEQEGLRPAIRKVCAAVHRIPGTGSVTSLNVSVAAGVALALLQGAH